MGYVVFCLVFVRRALLRVQFYVQRSLVNQPKPAEVSLWDLSRYPESEMGGWCTRVLPDGTPLLRRR